MAHFSNIPESRTQHEQREEQEPVIIIAGGLLDSLPNLLWIET